MMVAPLLSGCDKVTISDQVWYGTHPNLSAVQFHTLTTGQQNLSVEQWLTLLKNQPMLCTGVDTYARVKADYEKLCSICNCCNYDTTKAVSQYFNAFDRVIEEDKD